MTRARVRLIATLMTIGFTICAQSVLAATRDAVLLRGRSQVLHLYGERGGVPVIVSSGDGGWLHDRRDAPRDAMQGLFVHLLSWAKNEGYQQFALGMAPLSGFQDSPVAPFWTRMARLLYDHGEPVYPFRGLRAYKQKFDPEWVPQYLAYPGGLRLPLLLADVAILIAGGYRRVFLK